MTWLLADFQLKAGEVLDRPSNNKPLTGPCVRECKGINGIAIYNSL